MINELLRHFPKDTDPRIVSDTMISVIEQALPRIIQDVTLPAKMSATQRTAEIGRLQGRPGFKQASKSARPFVQARLDQANKVDAIWQVRAQLKQLSRSESSTTIGVPASETSAMASVELETMRQPTPNFTEILLRVPSSNSVTGAPSKLRASQNSSVIDPAESNLPTHPMPSSHAKLLGTDVRGKFALIQKGRLIDLVDSKLSVYELQPGTQQIAIPVQDLFRTLDLNALLATYARLSQLQTPATSGLSRSSEAKLIEALITSLELEEQWSALNRRRLYLITKRHTASLRESEHRELDRLQDLARDRANRVAPLPFSTIEFLKEYAQKSGLSD